jgi:hypothetical protein
LCKPVGDFCFGINCCDLAHRVMLSVAFPVVSSAPNLSRRLVPPLP